MHSFQHKYLSLKNDINRRSVRQKAPKKWGVGGGELGGEGGGALAPRT